MKHLAIAALVILALLAAVFGFAPKRRWVSRPTADATGPRYVTGEVIRIDPEDKAIVLRVGLGTGVETPVMLNALTRVRWRDSELEIGEIRPGDHATVRWLETEPSTTAAAASLDAGAGARRIAREVRIARATDEASADDEKTTDEESDESSSDSDSDDPPAPPAQRPGDRYIPTSTSAMQTH